MEASPRDVVLRSRRSLTARGVGGAALFEASQAREKRLETSAENEIVLVEFEAKRLSLETLQTFLSQTYDSTVDTCSSNFLWPKCTRYLLCFLSSEREKNTHTNHLESVLEEGPLRGVVLRHYISDK